MSSEEIINQFSKLDVNMVCPVCKKRGKLKIPSNIVKDNRNLTLVSVPAGIICKDTFQAYIDKQFKVRGYQKIDFEVNNIEYTDDEIDIFTSKKKFNKIKTILRDNIRKNNIIGSGIFSQYGKAIFTSIPYDSIIQIIKNIEVKNNIETIKIKRMYIELENNYLIFLETIDIDNYIFILMVLFSEYGTPGLGNLVLKKIISDINDLNH